MDYQEKLLELARKEGIQGLKGEKYEDVYNKVFIKLMNENERILVEKDCLFVIKEKAIEEMHEYRSKNEQLNKSIEFKDKCFYELHDKYIELEKENKELKDNNELINKKFLYLKDLAEEYDKLKIENEILRKLTKILL